MRKWLLGIILLGPSPLSPFAQSRCTGNSYQGENIEGVFAGITFLDVFIKIMMLMIRASVKVALIRFQKSFILFTSMSDEV